MRCPLCFHGNSSLLYPKTGSGRIEQCNRCDFVFSTSEPEDGDGCEKPAFVDSALIYSKNAFDRLGRLKSTTGISKGKLLDVGCYTGEFAAAAAEFGFDAFGVEAVEQAAKMAGDRFGIRVFQGMFEDARIDGAPFEVISFIHSFEHMSNPHQVVSRARNLLAENGALLIEIPNFDSWSRKVSGSKWRQFIGDHRLFYSPTTIRNLLESEGFIVRYLKPVPKYLSAGLFSDRVERYFSPKAGRALGSMMSRVGLNDRAFRLNLGDIMLVVATHKN